MDSQTNLQSLMRSGTKTAVALTVVAFATCLASADVVVMDQTADIFSETMTAIDNGSSLSAGVGTGAVTMTSLTQDMIMNLRGGSGGPYIATEPIQIIDGSRALTTAYYNNGGGGGGRPYPGGSFSSIPEPTSLARLGVGATGLLALRKRRR